MNPTPVIGSFWDGLKGDGQTHVSYAFIEPWGLVRITKSPDGAVEAEPIDEDGSVIQSSGAAPMYVTYANHKTKTVVFDSSPQPKPSKKKRRKRKIR